MNSLDDLRGTLEQRAAELHDSERYVRPVAVRERVRVARRRRASAVAVTAAVVLVGGVASVGALTGPAPVDPARPSVVGVEVPDAVEIHGFPYELTGTEPLQGEGDRLRLGRSDEPRAVSLVADGLGAGSATLYDDGVAVARAVGDDAVELPVPTGGAGPLRVRLDGAPPSARVGVAVYEATDELPPGVTNGVAVFRERVGGAELVEAAFSERGESEVSVPYGTGSERLQVSPWCRTDEEDLHYHVTIAGRFQQVGRCSATASRDAGGGSSYTPGGRRPVRGTVRMHLTRGLHGPVVEDTDAQLGVGVYRTPGTVRVAGLDVATLVENGGRTWTLVRQGDPVPGLAGEPLQVFRDVDDWATGIRTETSDLLVGFVAEGRRVRLGWEGELDRGASAAIDSGTGPASTVGGLLLRGDSYDVRITGDGRIQRGALLVYRPVDGS